MAAVFAIHPLRVESVAWVAEQGRIERSFLHVDLWLYARYAKPRHRGAGIVGRDLVCPGVDSQADARDPAFVLLLLDYWPLGRMAGMRDKGLVDE